MPGPARSLVRFQGHSNARPRSGTPWSISFSSAQPLGKQTVQLLCTPERGRMWACARKSPEPGPGERAPWSRTLAAPAKDPSLVLSTHIGRLTTVCNFSSRAFEPGASVSIYTHILVPTCQHTVLHLSQVGFHSGLKEDSENGFSLLQLQRDSAFKD